MTANKGSRAKESLEHARSLLTQAEQMLGGQAQRGMVPPLQRGSEFDADELAYIVDRFRAAMMCW